MALRLLFLLGLVVSTGAAQELFIVTSPRWGDHARHLFAVGPAPPSAADVVRSLFAEHTRGRGLAQGPSFTVTYEFQHPALSSRLVLVSVDGGGEALLRQGVADGALVSVVRSSDARGGVASYGQRVDLEAQIGGIGGGGAHASQGTASSPTRPPPDVAALPSPVLSWALDRIDQRLPDPLDSTFSTLSTAVGGVDVYIIDTGMLPEHVEFEGGEHAVGGSAVPPVPLPVATTKVNMALGANVIGDAPAEDARDPCHGHGTMVGSVVAGNTVGVSRNATLIPIRVIGCSGKFMVADVLKGIDYALSLATVRRRELGVRSLINLSARCFGLCSALDDAAQAAVESGVAFITVGGNEGKDACDTSPSRSPFALTVGATRQDARGDEWAGFSNYGACISLAAPGQQVYGASIAGPGQYAVWSGTSFAAPLATGVAAALWTLQPTLSARCVHAAVVALATRGTVRFTGAPEANGSTPSLLLFSPPWRLPALDRGGGSVAAPPPPPYLAWWTAFGGVAGGGGGGPSSPPPPPPPPPAGSPSDFVWPQVCVDDAAGVGGDGGEGVPIPIAPMPYPVRPPTSPLLSSQSGGAGGAAEQEGGGEDGDTHEATVLILEDATCTPRLQGQALQWDCADGASFPWEGGTGVGGPAGGGGWVTAWLEFGMREGVDGRGLVVWALSTLSTPTPLDERAVSALASLRALLSHGTTLGAVEVSALEVCVSPPLHGVRAASGAQHCLALPVARQHAINAGLQPRDGGRGVDRGPAPHAPSERWDAAGGAQAGRVRLRVGLQGWAEHPASAALLLAGTSPSVLFRSWMEVHGQDWAAGVGVATMTLRRSEVRAG